MATRDYWAVFGSGSPSTKSGLAPTFITFVTSTGANATPPSITEPGSKGLYKFSYDASLTMIAFVLDGATTGLATADRYVVGVLDPQDTFGITLNAIGVTLTGFANTAIALGTTGIALGTTGVALGTTNVALGTTNVALGTTGIALGVTNVALGTTNVALGTTSVALGTTAVALGNTNVAIGLSSPLFSFVGSTASSIGTTSTNPVDLFGFLKRAQEFAEGNQTYTKATGILDFYTRGGTLLAEKTVSDTSTQTTKT